MAEFTHLHLHTDYSLLDGACDVDKLVAHVASIGQKSVAMTDHGNIYGAVHFFDAAKKKGIKPILGCELYVCKKFLASHANGLIGFSGCLSGEFSEHLLKGDYDAAKASALQYQDIFGRGNFFLEIQDQGLKEEK